LCEFTGSATELPETLHLHSAHFCLHFLHLLHLLPVLLSAATETECREDTVLE
jgi:hypothetical protein